MKQFPHLTKIATTPMKTTNDATTKQMLVIHFPFPVKQVGERSISIEVQPRPHGVLHPDFSEDVFKTLGEKAGEDLLTKLSTQAERELIIQSITLENVKL